MDRMCKCSNSSCAPTKAENSLDSRFAVARQGIACPFFHVLFCFGAIPQARQVKQLLVRSKLQQIRLRVCGGLIDLYIPQTQACVQMLAASEVHKWIL